MKATPHLAESIHLIPNIKDEVDYQGKNEAHYTIHLLFLLQNDLLLENYLVTRLLLI